jgi:hypothetical protein
MKEARFIKNIWMDMDDWDTTISIPLGRALWQVKPGVEIPRSEGSTTEYVITSAIQFAGSQVDVETLAFPASDEGTILSWVDIAGSRSDTAQHTELLNKLGFTIVKEFSDGE